METFSVRKKNFSPLLLPPRLIEIDFESRKNLDCKQKKNCRQLLLTQKSETSQMKTAKIAAPPATFFN
jgi:hypothetical protein